MNSHAERESPDVREERQIKGYFPYDNKFPLRLRQPHPHICEVPTSLLGSLIQNCTLEIFPILSCLAHLSWCSNFIFTVGGFQINDTVSVQI